MASAIEPGAVIDGKYRVVRHIGEGGMGTVYEGENIRIERRVAIKVLHAHVASTPEFAQRFEREARASARIGSPYVCDVLDLGDLPNGERFIVMEFLDGESLEDRLGKGKLTAAQLAPIAFEILEGLGTMHQAGVVHRDLKPANIFLTRRGKGEVVKILDFGVAKILPRADEPSEMTSTGMMMGTPLYMSPEQARGARDVDGRTDLYAASVIFYRALTGEMPHTGDNLHELLFKIVLEEPKPICDHAPEVDPVFAAIVTKGLARDADQRFTCAREYQEEIADWGARQGRANLAFSVTLSSERPPLKSLSGGYPVARMLSPITGPQPRSENIGPPTPALAKTQADTARSTKQSGGTPVVWSEDAPEIAKKALAALESTREKRAAASVGTTQVIDERPPAPSAMSPTTTVASAAPPRPQGRGRLIGAVAILALGAVAVGARMATQGTTTTGSSHAVSTHAAAPDSSLVPPPAPSPEATALTTPSPDTTTSAQPVAIPPPPVRTVAVGTVAPVPRAAPTASASAAKSAAPTASTAAAPVPTTSGRKFRTNLE